MKTEDELFQHYLNMQITALEMIRDVDKLSPGETMKLRAFKVANEALKAKPVASFILVDGEYHQLAEQYKESPDAIKLYGEKS